jgi:hypothetical protein
MLRSRRREARKVAKLVHALALLDDPARPVSRRLTRAVLGVAR